MSLEVISYNSKTVDSGGISSLAAILPIFLNMETKEVSLEIDTTLLVKEGKLSVTNPIPSLEGNAGKTLVTDGTTMSWNTIDTSNSYTRLEIDQFFEGITPIVGYNNTSWNSAYTHSMSTSGTIHGISVLDITYKSKDNQFIGYNQFLGETDFQSIDFVPIPVDSTADPIVYITPDYKEGRVFYNIVNQSLSLFNSQIDTVQTVSLEGHKHFQLYQPDGTNPFVYTDNSGVLHIDGGIIQNGTSYETHAEQVYTKQDIITLRDGAISGLIDGQYVGFKALKYDGVNDGHLVFDNTGTARVGDVGSEQPITTRIESPTNGKFAIWDNDNSRLDFKDIALSDLPTISYPELLRGSYRYDSQIPGVDTIGDWRTYSDDLGYYTQYCTVGGTRTTSTWVTKNTIIT